MRGWYFLRALLALFTIAFSVFHAVPGLAQQACEAWVNQCLGGDCTGSSYDPNLVEFPMSAGPTGTEFNWDASFYAYENTAASKPTIEIFLWVELSGPVSVPVSLQQEWEDGIEHTWRNRYGLRAPNGTVYGVNVDVEFIINQNLLALRCANLRVTVQQGPGNFELDKWYITTPSPHPQAALAAHEIGHLLGNFDEYPGGAVDPADTTYWSVPGNIMGANLADVVEERHYLFVRDWANQALAASGGGFQLVPAAFIGTTVHVVPYGQPALLLLAGMLMAVVHLARHKR